MHHFELHCYIVGSPPGCAAGDGNVLIWRRFRRKADLKWWDRRRGIARVVFFPFWIMPRSQFLLRIHVQNKVSERLIPRVKVTR